MKLDELELPDTLFVRDIDDQVFQGIAIQCLSNIKGIYPLENTFLDAILGHIAPHSLRGIHAEQDPRTHSVNFRIEVNIAFGTPIPEKAEEIQNTLSQEIPKMTGLHVGCIHVVFKNVIAASQPTPKASADDGYNDEF